MYYFVHKLFTVFAHVRMNKNTALMRMLQAASKRTDIHASIIEISSKRNGKSHEAVWARRMGLLHEEIINRLEIQLKSEKIDCNDVQNGRHIQNSSPESSSELEPCSGREQEAKPEPTRNRVAEPIKAFPLGMVMRACRRLPITGPAAKLRAGAT